MEVRALSNKILVYVNEEDLKMLRKVLGDKPYAREFYGKLGVDIYRTFMVKKVGDRSVLHTVYFWVVNPSEVFDFIRSKYNLGADGLVVVIDYDSPKSLNIVVKSLLETLKNSGLKIPIAVLVKVPDEIYDNIEDKLNKKLFEAEMDLLVQYKLLVGFYIFSEKKTRNIYKAIKNLVGIITNLQRSSHLSE